LSRTTEIPRSSEAFNSKTRRRHCDGCHNWRHKAKATDVLPLNKRSKKKEIMCVRHTLEVETKTTRRTHNRIGFLVFWKDDFHPQSRRFSSSPLQFIHLFTYLPGGPYKSKCGSRPVLTAFCRVATTSDWCETSLSDLGRYRSTHGVAVSVVLVVDDMIACCCLISRSWSLVLLETWTSCGGVEYMGFVIVEDGVGLLEGRIFWKPVVPTHWSIHIGIPVRHEKWYYHSWILHDVANTRDS